MNRRIRIGMGIASVLLLGIEILIGMYAHGWVRGQLGDVLVVILLYTICRTVSPKQPRFAMTLPAGILLFAYIVEYLQFWGFCDKLHITNQLLRIIIGTGYSNADMLSYTLGILPCILCEYLLYRPKKRGDSGLYLPAFLLGIGGALGLDSLLVWLSAFPAKEHPVAFPVSSVCGICAACCVILLLHALIRKIRETADAKGKAVICSLILCTLAFIPAVSLWLDAFSIGSFIVQRI